MGYPGQTVRRSRCERCSAGLIWGRTENGKWLPLEIDPFARDSVPPEHRLRLEGDRVLRDPRAVREAVVVVSHFVVCPPLLKAETLARLWDEWPDLAGRAERHGSGRRVARHA